MPNSSSMIASLSPPPSPLSFTWPLHLRTKLFIFLGSSSSNIFAGPTVVIASRSSLLGTWTKPRGIHHTSDFIMGWIETNWISSVPTNNVTMITLSMRARISLSKYMVIASVGGWLGYYSCWPRAAFSTHTISLIRHHHYCTHHTANSTWLIVCACD